jgi:hypothetical protein
MMRLAAVSVVMASILTAAYGDSDPPTLHKACNMDVICAGVKPGEGRVLGCLREHLSTLTEECFAALGRSMLKSAPAQQVNATAHPGQVLQSDGTFAPASGEAH